MRICMPLRSILVSSLLLALTAGSLLPAAAAPTRAAAAPMAQVRLLHAVVGAPAVDVYIDGFRTFGGASYGDLSAYEMVAPGNHLLQVFPTGAKSSGTGLVSVRIMLQANKMYTLALGGMLGRIRPLLVGDNVTPPTKGMARVRVVHLSADTPAVDVAVKGGPILFANKRYATISPYLEVAAGTVDLQVRPAGWPIAAKTIPMVTLLAGSVYTFYAIGSLAGPAQGLRIMADVLPTLARVRIVHAVPGAGPVDVYVDGDRAFTRASFGDVSTYESVPAGVRHIQVFPAGKYPNLVIPPATGGLIDVKQAVVAGSDYTVAASVTAGKVAPVVLTDDNTAPSKGMVKIHVIHLSPDAPAVDVAGMMGKRMIPFATAVAYQATSAPVEVMPGNYAMVGVMPTATTKAVVSVSGVTLAADSIYTVFVVGSVKGHPALMVVVNQDQ